MIPLRKMPVPSEDAEQFTVVSWLRWHRIRFHHSPNGGVRHITTAKRLKAQGTSPGFPDLIILDPPKFRPECHSCAVEMKRTTGGKVSEHQQEWLLALEERGWLTIIAKGAEEAIKALEAAGYGGISSGGQGSDEKS